MPMTIRVGLTKKVGQAHYGSFGASCQIDLEFDPQQCQGKPLALQAKISEAFCLCKTAVESELALERQLQASGQQAALPQWRYPGNPASPWRVGQDHRQMSLGPNDGQLSDGQLSGGQLSGGQLSGGQLSDGQLHDTPTKPILVRQPSDQPVRQATAAQLKVLQRTADQLRIDLRREVEQHFGVAKAEALTIRQASWLIDHLKSIPVSAST